MLPVALACLYLVLFVFYPAGYALINNDTELAIDIAKWNLTHLPPSQGPTVRCMRENLHTAEAEVLKRKVLDIGRELEAQHGYQITGGTSVSVVGSLGEHGGLAHYSSADSCIQIALTNSPNLDSVIRHEWAHIAAERHTEQAAHGPVWQVIADTFGVDNAGNYSHCDTGDYDCQPRY